MTQMKGRILGKPHHRSSPFITGHFRFPAGWTIPMSFSAAALAFIAVSTACAHPAAIPSNSTQKVISIQECNRIHLEVWLPMLPTQAADDWRKEWKQFREMIRTGDRIIQWAAPSKGPKGLAIERKAEIIAIFELAPSTATSNAIPCDFSAHGPT